MKILQLKMDYIILKNKVSYSKTSEEKKHFEEKFNKVKEALFDLLKNSKNPKEIIYNRCSSSDDFYEKNRKDFNDIIYEYYLSLKTEK